MFHSKYSRTWDFNVRNCMVGTKKTAQWGCETWLFYIWFKTFAHFNFLFFHQFIDPFSKFNITSLKSFSTYFMDKVIESDKYPGSWFACGKIKKIFAENTEISTLMCTVEPHQWWELRYKSEPTKQMPLTALKTEIYNIRTLEVTWN